MATHSWIETTGRTRELRVTVSHAIHPPPASVKHGAFWMRSRWKDLFKDAPPSNDQLYLHVTTYCDDHSVSAFRKNRVQVVLFVNGTSYPGDVYDELEVDWDSGDNVAVAHSYELRFSVEECIKWSIEDTLPSEYFGSAPQTFADVYERTNTTSFSVYVDGVLAGSIDIPVGVRLGTKQTFDWASGAPSTESDPLGYPPHRFVQADHMIWSGMYWGGAPYEMTPPPLPNYGVQGDAGWNWYTEFGKMRLDVWHTETNRSSEDDTYHDGWGFSSAAVGSQWADPAYRIHTLGTFKKFDREYETVIDFLIAAGEYYRINQTPDAPAKWTSRHTGASGIYDRTDRFQSFSWMGPPFGLTWPSDIPIAYWGMPIDAWFAYAMDSRHGKWLFVNKENLDDTGIAPRGPKFNSFTAQQAETYAVDDGTATNWANEQNTTVTQDGGEVKFVVAGGSGIASRSWSAGQMSFQQYRYLRIRARADTMRSLVIRIEFNDKFHPTDTDYWGNRTYQDHPLVVDGSATWYTIDLELPSSYAAGGAHGVDGSVTKVRLRDLENGGTYWVDAIELKMMTVADGYAPSQILHRSEFEEEAVPVRPPDFPRRALLWHTNGQVSVDCRTNQSLADLLSFADDEIHAGGASAHGVTITDLAPSTPGGYYENDISTAEPYTDNWTGREVEEKVWTTRNHTTLYTYLRQCRADFLHIYPGAGDWAGLVDGAWGDIYVEWHKALRGQAHGLAYDTDLGATIDYPVIVTKSDLEGLLLEKDVGYLEGYFHSHPGQAWPYQTNPRRFHLYLDGDEANQTDWDAYSRRLHRKYILATPTTGGGNSWIERSWHGFIFQAWDNGSVVKIRRKAQGESSWNTYDVTTGTRPCLCIDPGRNHPLVIVYENAGEIYYRVSYTNGETWDAPVAVMTGKTHPHLTKDKGRGIEYYLGYASSNLYLRRRDAGGWIDGAEFSVLAGVPEQTACLELLMDRDNTLALSYVDGSGNIRLAVSKDNGLTFNTIA